MNIDKIREYAIIKHGNQMYDDKPYLYHLDKVSELAKKYNMGLKYELAAYIHDVLEDTNATKNEIIQLSDESIYDMVFSVSGFGKNRTEKRNDILFKLKNNIEAINLKMLDRIENMEYSLINNKKLFEMYKKEIEFYDEYFKLGDSKLYEHFKGICIETKKPKFY